MTFEELMIWTLVFAVLLSAFGLTWDHIAQKQNDRQTPIMPMATA